MNSDFLSSRVSSMDCGRDEVHVASEQDGPPIQEGSTGRSAEMDMTPMVDVTFLLLIFFMVTAAFAVQKSLPLPPDLRGQTVESELPAVVVHIDSYNTFLVRTPSGEEEAPSEHEMLVQLRHAREAATGSQPQGMLVVAADEALHEKVIAALDAGSRVGFDHVRVAMNAEALPSYASPQKTP